MLGKVPEISSAKEYHDSIHFKLVSYEDEYIRLKEVASLMELALWKFKMLDQIVLAVGDDSAVDNWQYLAVSGSSTVIVD
jgi:hypothetical protein